MDDKILTTVEAKTAALLKGALSHFPDATAVDLEKNTPRRRELLALIDAAARELTGTTGDKTWNRIAAELRNRARKSKPVAGYETKSFTK